MADRLRWSAYLIEVRERDIDLRAGLDFGGKHLELTDQVPRHGLLATVVSVSAPAELRSTVPVTTIIGTPAARQ